MKQSYDIIGTTPLVTSYTNKNGVPYGHQAVDTFTKRSAYSHSGTVSPRKQGELLLRANAYKKDTAEERWCIYRVKGRSTAEPRATMDTSAAINAVTIANGTIIDKLRSETAEAASKKFISKVASLNANIALAILERREMLSLVRTLMVGGYKKLKDFHKLTQRLERASDKQHEKMIKQYITGLKTSGVSAGKNTLANAWLMTTYGISPIVSDILTAIKHKKLLKKGVITCSVRRHADSRSSTVRHPYVDVSFWHDAYCTVKCQAHVEVSDPLLKMMAEFGFTNPFLLAYERIPYSFVLDWFIDIGSWLQGFSAYHGVTITGYNVTTTTTTMLTQGSFKPKPVVSGMTINGELIQPANVKRVQKVRSLPSPPTSKIELDFPIDWRQHLSGLALLNQNLAKIRVHRAVT